MVRHFIDNHFHLYTVMYCPKRIPGGIIAGIVWFAEYDVVPIRRLQTEAKRPKQVNDIYTDAIN